MNRTALYFINKYLSDYLENISNDQLEVSLFSGKITMENVRVKSHVLQLIGFPFELKYAKIGKINISYSLTSILSKPINIEISEIFAFINPVESSKWSESSLKELLTKTRQMKLDQFEALQDAELESSMPEFLKRWLIKIIDNVQVSIQSIYLRYEDSLTGYQEFNLGFILKSLKASTCDYNWEKTSNPKSSKTLYKLIEVESFAIFNDFEENSIYQKKYIGQIDETFDLLVYHEMDGDIKHNYIIEPFTIEAKILINKELDKSSPLITVQGRLDKFVANIYDGQIRSGLQIFELIKLFLKFLLGIDKAINYKDFTDEEEKKYIEVYKKFREAQKKGKTRRIEKLRKEILELEKEVSSEYILDLRQGVILNIIKSKIIREKEKEIDKINRGFRGPWAKFKSGFSKLSELEYENMEQEVNAKIDEAKKQIKKINEASLITIEKKKEDDWMKVFIEFSIGCVSVCMQNEGNPLFKLEIESIILALGLKTGIFMEINLASTRLIDLFNPNSKFPYFFDMGKVSLYLEDDPLSLELSGGDIVIYGLTKKILNIANIMKNLFFSKVDISVYANVIMSKYTDYLESGSDFLKALFKEGQVKLPTIKVNCKAPLIIFPGNLEENNDYLVIDSGAVIAHTLFASSSEVHYYFELQKFKIYVMSNTQLSEGVKVDLLSLNLINISFNFSSGEASRVSSSLIKMTCSLNDIIIVINPWALVFLDKIEKQLAKVLPEIMVVQSSKTVQSLSIYESFDPRKNVSVEIPNEVLENARKTTRKFKNDGIPVFIKVNVKKIYVKVIEDNKDFFEVGASQVDCDINIDSSMFVAMEYKVKEFYVKDLKHGGSFLNVFLDPYPKPNKHQIILKIQINPETFLTHLSIVVNSIRITIFSKFIEALMSYYKKYYDLIKLPKISLMVPTETPAYTLLQSNYLQMSIICHKVEIWFPSKSTTDCVMFDLTSHLDFKQVFTYKITYSSNDLPISHILSLQTQEMDLLAGHFSASLIKTDNSAKPEVMITPFRAKLQIEGEISDEQNLNLLKMQILVEPVQFCFNIQKMKTFISLGFEWVFFLMPGAFMTVVTKSNLIMDVTCDNFDLDIVRKTDTVDYLGRVEVREAKVHLEQGEFGEKIKCNSKLAVHYFNRKISQWQSVIDMFPVLLDLFIKGENIEPDVRIYETISVNVTYELIEMGLDLFEFFSKGVFHDVVKEEGVLVIENQLDQSLFFWIAVGENKEMTEVKGKSKITVKNSDIEKTKNRYRKNVRWTYEIEMNQMNYFIGLSSELYQSNAVMVSVNESVIKIINLSGKNLLLENNSQGSSRVIKVQNSIFAISYIGNKHELFSITDREYSDCARSKFPELPENVDLSKNELYKAEKFNIVVEQYSVSINSSQSCDLIEIKPEFIVKNLLREDINIVNENNETIKILHPNESLPFNQPLDKEYSILLKINNFLLKTNPFKFQIEPHKKVLVHMENYPESSIVLKLKKNHYKSKHILKDLEKKEKNLKIFSHILEIFSEYILENLSHMDLNVSSLILKKNSALYFSDLEKKQRLRSLSENSKPSDFFKIDTIGLTGMIPIEYIDSPSGFIGIKISQAEHHLISTKHVVFTPGYLAWNYLDIPIYILLNNSVQEIRPRVSESSFFVVDGLGEDYSIMVSLNSQNWSSKMRVNELNDFQIILNCEAIDEENETLWYLPSFSNNYKRIVRVVIQAEDEATIHVCFINPSDPDFRIVNKTEEPLFVKQAGIDEEDELVVPPFDSRPWVWWCNLVENKKVKVKYFKESQYYSLEKVKDYEKKPLGDCTVSVVIAGSTRELWVKSKFFTVNKSRNSKEFFLVTKEYNEQIISNPRFGIQGSLVPLPELMDTMSETVVKSMAEKKLVKIKANIFHISIQLYSSGLTHLFGVSIKGLLVDASLNTYSLDRKNKINASACVRLKNLQVYSIESIKNNIESILNIQPDKNTEHGLSLDTDYELILKTKDQRTDQIHRIDNFELTLGLLAVSINEQSLYSLLSFEDHFKLIQPFILIKKPAVSGITEPRVSNLSTMKIYFKLFKLNDMKISLYIKKSRKRLDFSVFSNLFFYPVLRLVTGTLLSEQQVDLVFSKVYIFSAFQNFENFGMMLAKDYLRQGVTQFYKMLGFFDILVNPLKFIGSIGTAVFDFFSDPLDEREGAPKTFAKALHRNVKAMVNK